MKPRNLTGVLAALASMILFASSAGATTVLEMNLAALTEGADMIFRGTVLDVSETSVQAGGGTIKAIKYTIIVDEAFKGDFPLVKEQRIAEIKMVGSLKQYHRGVRVIPGFPLLKIGSDYLLMVAPAGPIGLTSTMGLGQGAFSIFHDPNTKEEMALNDANNASLFKGMAGLPQEPGAVTYADLVEAINTELSQ